MMLLRSERGSAMIELAIFMSVLVLLLSGIADYAIYLHQEMELSEAAAAGAALGAVPGHQKDTSNMQLVAQQSCPDIQNLNVTATYFYTCTPGGAQVANTAMCANYGTPIMYVSVVTTATVPPALKWTGLTNNMALKGTAIYRVPWTL